MALSNHRTRLAAARSYRHGSGSRTEVDRNSTYRLRTSSDMSPSGNRADGPGDPMVTFADNHIHGYSRAPKQNGHRIISDR